MTIPSHGFRHAVTLLISGRVRSIAPNAAPADVEGALADLASEMVALGRDMKMTPDAAEWAIGEYQRTVERLAQTIAIDAEGVIARGRRILSSIGDGVAAAVDRRDLFIVYVPEDRLPMAAPLAVELSKRRIAVAFSEYEVADTAQAIAAIVRGLREHKAGIVLATLNFVRHPWTAETMKAIEEMAAQATDRLRIIDEAGSRDLEKLMRWLSISV
jgi:hypothetical protein